MIRQSLNIGAVQQLQLTPKLQQAIQMLQLSSQELTQEIQAIIESNILLEVDEPFNDIDVPESQLEETSELKGISEDPHESEETIETDWNTEETSSRSTSSELPSIIERTYHPAQDLRGYLIEQLQLSSLKEKDFEIGEMIVDAINEDGFLMMTIEDLQKGLKALGVHAQLEKIETVLKLVQGLGPVGVGARDLKESLLLQLNALPSEMPGLALAKMIVEEYLHFLGEHHYLKLCRACKVDEGTLSEAIQLIQSLKPRPGSVFTSSANFDQIIPDVMVKKSKGGWKVSLNKTSIPRLQLNNHYISVLENGTKESNEVQFINKNLQEARWLMKCLHHRNETLLKVASCIVKHQQAFLRYGPGAMKPLVLKDIAEDVELHQSTISRITTRKYIQTPQGTFELRYFFTSHLNTSYGEQCSALATRTYIQEMIKNEDAEKPFSDEVIAKKLLEQGVQVARRTVAKYRELLGIESANRRKRLLSKKLQEIC